jgi:hypothetical protein
MRFEEILQHDRDIFDEPFQWQNKTINESPLITDFDNIWAKIKNIYQTELSAYAYRPIPFEIDVAACFKQLTKRI